MPTQPTPPAKPSTPPPPSQPKSQPSPPPAPPKPSDPAQLEKEHGRKGPPDPQAAKLEAHAGPPTWQEPSKQPKAPPPPDGPTIADEQRARSAEIEKQGMKKYQEGIDQRPPEERTNKQVPGVVPPTKRE
jgi:hypothetical protein